MKDKKGLIEDLEFVRKSAKKVVSFMLDENVPLAERKNEIQTMRTAVAANTNIVSAIINTIAIEKMSED